MELMNIGIGLLCLIIINIVLGAVGSLFEEQFDRVKLFRGVVKGFVVLLCFVGTFYVATLTPNVIVVNVNGNDANLLTGINIIVVSGYIWYGKEVLMKLAKFVNGKFEVTE